MDANDTKYQTPENSTNENMNSTTLLKPGVTLAALLLTGGPAFAQHSHLEAGAVGENQNDPLTWANGDNFAVSSGYVQPMIFATSGRYAGLFNSGPTFTALAATAANGGPEPGAAALGSFLAAEIVSVSGPIGAQFAFWEGEDLGGGSSPLFSILTGDTALSYQFALSDASLGAGIAGQDPFGHLHGRRFTTTAEGLYTVGFRVLDISVNGTGGGPIHLPSAVLYMNFATVPEPSVFVLAGLSLAGAWWLRRKRIL